MYAYHELIYDLIRIDVFQKEMSFFSIGNSVAGQHIFCVKAGNGDKKALVVCGHHSLETILSEFLMEYLFRSRPEWFRDITLYAVPLLNPDGADIVAGRLKNPALSFDKSHWQTNYRGVDLNHNYDAGFYLAQEIVAKEGILGPHFTKYGGEIPFSEPETQAIKRLCEKIPFDLAIAFHSQGEEIYYDYNGIMPEDTPKYIERFQTVSKYRIAKPSGTASHGGMKDWFLQTYQKPAFTIEAGVGKNPLPHSLFPKIYTECSTLLNAALDTLRSL